MKNSIIKSYHFIPLTINNLKDKINSIKSDYIVIDFEDSILEKELYESYELLKGITPKENIYVRLRYNPLNTNITHFQLNFLLKNNFKKFFLPKIKNKKDLVTIKHCIETIGIDYSDFVIIVENPDCLINIKNILESKILNISGLALGSHDFMNSSGFALSPNITFMLRTILSIYCAAYNVKRIDTASMEIRDVEEFKKEVKTAIQLGYEGKIIIHPKQLIWLDQVNFDTLNELNMLASELHLQHKKLGYPAAFIYDGKIIEKPHLNYFLKFL